MKAIAFAIFLTSIFDPLVAWERTTSFPYLSGDTWRFFCDWECSDVKTFDPKSVKCGDTIFVEKWSLEDFGKNYLPYITEQCIIISPNCERGADESQPGPHKWLLDSDKIAAWLMQNINCEPTERMVPIPIGIANTTYSHGNTALLDKYIPIALNTPPEERNLFVYINFSDTHPSRKTCRNYFKTLPFVTFSETRSYEEYLKDLADTIFVVSPPGNGLDCHRTWEALLMGCYPIVLSSTLNPLYAGLPVAIVNDWSEVTGEFLIKKYQELTSKSWPSDKLYAPYWFEKVQEIQAKLKNK